MVRVRDLEARVRNESVVEPRDVLAVGCSWAAVVQPRKGRNPTAAHSVSAQAGDPHGVTLGEIFVQLLVRILRNWMSADGSVCQGEQNQAAEGNGEGWSHCVVYLFVLRVVSWFGYVT